MFPHYEHPSYLTRSPPGLPRRSDVSALRASVVPDPAPPDAGALTDHEVYLESQSLFGLELGGMPCRNLP